MSLEENCRELVLVALALNRYKSATVLPSDSLALRTELVSMWVDGCESLC